jgi:succinate dehydrogenase flavin-adding protein (antitoxin of CptAB toxin-antitoxin module)
MAKAASSGLEQMMDVSDEDLTTFAHAREELQKRFDNGHAEKSIRMLQERKERFRQAVEAGSQSRR